MVTIGASDRRGPSGLATGSGAGPLPLDAAATTIWAGAYGSRHGSASASDHQGEAPTGAEPARYGPGGVDGAGCGVPGRAFPPSVTAAPPSRGPRGSAAPRP